MLAKNVFCFTNVLLAGTILRYGLVKLPKRIKDYSSQGSKRSQWKH